MKHQLFVITVLPIKLLDYSIDIKNFSVAVRNDKIAPKLKNNYICSNYMHILLISLF